MKVAIIQQQNRTDLEANHAHSRDQIRQAAANGAQLVVLQELHSGPYFCQVEATDFFDLAEPIDGPTRQYFEALAKELDIVLVCSIFEKRAAGLYHNTALVFDGSSGLAGFYRKMHIPDDPGFYEKFYFTPGDADNIGFQPITTKVGKLGVLVCWDQWYPEAARLMALAGAELLIYPTAIGWDMADDAPERQRQLDAWMLVQRGHAVANGLPVLAPNRVGTETAPDGNTINFWGNSFICGPQGEMLAQADSATETVLSIDIDMQRSESVRRIWPFLRDRRVDAYADLTKRYRD